MTNPIKMTVLLLAGMLSSAWGGEQAAIPVSPATTPPAFVITPARTTPVNIGLGRRLLWYVPNRIMDFADIFRFRVRLGPGMAAGVRLTDYGSFYAGNYSSLYAGLPGPRNPRYVRWPVGRESLRGIVLGGVDATDDTLHGPDYGPTEVDLGFHILLVGAEAGIDPVEIGDFLAGLAMFDLAHDDYPRLRGPGPGRSSGVSRGATVRMIRQDDKPVTFSNFCDRLDYLHTNVQTRISKPVRTVDERFAPDAGERLAVPDSRMRVGLYSECVQHEGFSLSFQPDIDLDVALPNMEKRMNVFVQSGYADKLPGRTPSESRDRDLLVGVRRYFREHSFSTDAGVRMSLHPRAYGRIQWHPRFQFDQWSIRPQQRFFLDTRDKLGSLSTLFVDRWLGAGHEYFVGSVSSAKYITETDETTWEQTFKVGRLRERLEERPSFDRFERRDVASGGDLAFSIFGTDGEADTYRLTIGVRRPLYQRWIFWDIEPGLEWVKDHDFETGFRVTAGIDMLFWGPGGN